MCSRFSIKIHYAWVICTACTIMMFVSMGLNANILSIYQPYIIRENGFTNTQGSLLIAIRNLLSIAGMLSVDWMSRRFGLRQTIGIGMCLGVLSRLVFAVSSTFSAYCAAAALAGVTFAWAGTVPITVLISHWFHSRQGVALGIGTTGSGVATVVMPPLVTAVIERYGIALSFSLEALFTAVLTCIVVVLVQDQPEALGTEPYTSKSASPASTPLSVCSGKNPNSWKVLLPTVFLLAGPVGPGFSHLATHYATVGYSPGYIAGLMAYLGAALIIGKILCGEIIDRLGGRKSNFIIGSALVSAQVFCCLAGTKKFVFPSLSMTLFGLGLPITSVSLSQWARDLTEESSYERAIKWSTLAYAVGSFLFSPIPGLVADCTGSYAPAYALFILLTLISLTTVQRTYRTNQ